jgi:hypothetical protein
MCLGKVTMFSFGVKIQILLFMVVILVGLYLFVLQKEMRMMQQDFAILKKQVQIDNCPIKPRVTTKHENVVIQPDEDEDEDYDEDDDASVSSLEIKEILTNIDIGEEITPGIDDVEGDDMIGGEDLSLFVEAELEKLKCEDLRSYLRSRSMDIKGKKPELIQKIMSISQ